jgi:hypothetical protein
MPECSAARRRLGPVQTGVADGHFLQRLQAVGGEARRDDVDIAQLLPAPFQQTGVRVRLKPWRTSETALVADRPRFPFQPQSVGKQARRALALEKIGAMPNLAGNWWSSEEIAEELGEPKADRLRIKTPSYGKRCNTRFTARE